jgi:hypothetical protein
VQVKWSGIESCTCVNSSYVTSDVREKCTGSSTEFVSCYIKTLLPSCEPSTAPVQRDVTMDMFVVGRQTGIERW